MSLLLASISREEERGGEEEEETTMRLAFLWFMEDLKTTGLDRDRADEACAFEWRTPGLLRGIQNLLGIRDKERGEERDTERG